MSYRTRTIINFIILIIVSSAICAFTVSAIQQINPPFPEIKPIFIAHGIQAKALYVYSPSTGEVIYQKNSSTILPLASLTKIMTALVAEQIRNEPVSPEVANAFKMGNPETVPISEKALKLDGDQGLKNGEVWSIDELIKLMLLSSSNDAAAAIRQHLNDYLFVNEMNDLAKRLNLNTLSFTNETGLDNSTETIPGDTGTAKDMAKLFNYFVTKYPDIAAATRLQSSQFISLSGFSHVEDNTDKAIPRIPTIMASKTGFTDLAGGNLVFEFKSETKINRTPKDIIVVILGSTKEGRFSDAITLKNSVNNYLDN